MLTGFCQTTATFSLLLSLSISTVILQVRAGAALPQLPPSSDQPVKRGSNNPLGIDWNPAPSPEDGPPGAANALRNPAYLPAQIGGIVGSYAFSLVVVALILLALSKKRREHLRAAEELEQVWDDEYEGATAVFQSRDELWQGPPIYPNREEYPPGFVSHQLPKSPGHGHVRNFSLPSPTSVKFEAPRFDFSRAEAPRFENSRFEESQEAPSPSSYFLPSPTSTTRGPLGQDPDVNQDIVQRDRAMAQSQLEQMYKYVMEQEEAKEAGVEFRAPMVPAEPRSSTMTSSSKKEKNKPASLNLNKGEKTQSRTSSILSALKSPRKKKQMQGISISSPIMTPMSGTFPQYVGEEMNTIPPRQYAPAIPPPVPMGHSHASFAERRNIGHIAPLMTPDLSPESTQSIDERLRAIATGKGKDREQRGVEDDDRSDEEGEGHDQVGQLHSRHISMATTEADPVSAVSETSQSGLLRNTPGMRTSGLPTSPKPGVNRFPSLPSSPKPGATFSRPNAPSAVRTGGMLPLRAYENAMVSPTSYDRTVKETVFQRAGPMSPGGMHTARTPLTGNPVPYSPYQPFSPVVPITPSLVTKADRKRMKRMEPKTPTLQMVKSDDELW